MTVTKDNQLLAEASLEAIESDSHDRQLHPALQTRRQRFWQFFIDRGPTLTIIALLLSMIQLIQASCGAQDIKQIANSVSTQYVDVFPQNMPEIIALINRTEHKLIVITDVAAYGHFSSPSDSAKYIRALEAVSDADRKIHIEVLCYDSTKAHQKLAEQFPIKDFAAFIKNSEKYQTYLTWHKGSVPQSADALYDQIISAGETLKASLRSNGTTTVKTTFEDLPIFMWIRDDKEAIFSLHNYGESPREDSFRTTDDRFIVRLREISKEALNKAGSDPAPLLTIPQGGTPALASPTVSVPSVESPKR